MTRDPFYQQILARLSGRLDPELFERCAAALLRPVYPGLVPVRGGSDAGMDGAISDGEGTAFPLICTTGEDVIGNMQGSMRSYRDKGGTRDKAVVATSQELTPPRRRNLEEAAGKLGFTLVGIHTQASFADLVYRDSRWCLELLNLTGDPPALSALPLNNRPALSSTLIGRDEDLAWLRARPDDLLVVGQPGAGKTSLLCALALPGEGLFVADHDMGRIATGLREQQPPALLVDDAHLCPDLLARLRRLRELVGASFRIIADCWPGEQDAVAQALGIASSARRALELLSRARIVEIIKACGIDWPNSLLHELVRQAAGKPGLAVTLCHLYLREGGLGIALADALARDVRTTFERLVGPEASLVLAAFAIGGECGMPMLAVARELDLARAQVHRLTSRLAAGGVLDEVVPGTLAVRPEPLRHALVRDLFFDGPACLPADGLIHQAPDPESVARTLIGARGRGGRVGLSLVADLLGPHCSDETWSAFASLGPEESRWVLRKQPERLLAAAPYTLEHVPEETVPLLLRAEADGRRLGPSGSGPALEALRAWARAGFPGTGEAVRRRQAILGAALRWMNGGGCLTVALEAARIALSPAFTDYEFDPADPHRFDHRFGYVTLEEMAVIQGMWDEARERLRAVRVEDWSPLKELVGEWAYPGRLPGQVSQEVARAMVSFGVRILRELTELAHDDLGVLHWVVRLANIQGTQLDVQFDPEFTILFPFRDGPDWRAEQEEQAGAARDLAQRWTAARADEVARKLVAWDAAMRVPQDRPWPRWSPFVCWEIASRSATPAVWFAALRDAGAVGDLIEPFLRRTVEVGEPGWPERLEACLANPPLQAAVVAIVLQSLQLPPGLLERALGCLDGLRAVAEALTIRGILPEDRVRLLLDHEDAQVASSAALGEWHCDPVGVVRPSLVGAWRRAVVRCVERPHKEILRHDPDLAHDWLAARLQVHSLSVLERGPGHEALVLLSSAQRLSLLAQIPADRWAGGSVRWLVGDDTAVYGQILADERLRRHHLAPLLAAERLGGQDTAWPSGPLNDAWIAKALLALNAGYSPDEVARAVRSGAWSYCGSEAAMWEEWAARFRGLGGHPDPRIRCVGQAGEEEALARAEQARRHEWREAIYGEELGSRRSSGRPRPRRGSARQEAPAAARKRRSSPECRGL
jgi:hypothetical protein